MYVYEGNCYKSCTHDHHTYYDRQILHINLFELIIDIFNRKVFISRILVSDMSWAYVYNTLYFRNSFQIIKTILISHMAWEFMQFFCGKYSYVCVNYCFRKCQKFLMTFLKKKPCIYFDNAYIFVSEMGYYFVLFIECVKNTRSISL